MKTRSETRKSDRSTRTSAFFSKYREDERRHYARMLLVHAVPFRPSSSLYLLSRCFFQFVHACSRIWKSYRPKLFPRSPFNPIMITINRWLRSSPACFVALLILFIILWNSFYSLAPTTAVLEESQVSSTIVSQRRTESGKCKWDKPPVIDSLPRGIITSTSDLELKPLFGPRTSESSSSLKNLLAIPVGIKQKEIVNQIVSKFISCGFQVMMFHYDGFVDEWRVFPWYDQSIHVSAINQAKWWFAKRFLHPDIISEYNYVFLWDEDLDVENFHPERYLKIIKEEGLEISQPALDARHGSKVHHRITARDPKQKLHRRIYKHAGGFRCYENSTGPPCTGWVEMMAPVFSRAAWRCTWHMIQNDLIYAWGLDYRLGYCAQGERSLKIGVVDAEYVVHKDIPTLGGSDDMGAPSPSPSSSPSRSNVRRQSHAEMEIFKRRWEKAAKEDTCWSDPYST
ncbi:uncharacterized protein LOC144704918 isoform X2 [Wolffia australiana]